MHEMYVANSSLERMVVESTVEAHILVVVEEVVLEVADTSAYTLIVNADHSDRCPHEVGEVEVEDLAVAAEQQKASENDWHSKTPQPRKAD